MSRSSAADAAAVLDLAAELFAVPSEQLPDVVMARLPTLVAGDLVVMNSVRSDAADLRHASRDAPAMDWSARFTDVLAEHPVVGHYLSTSDRRPCRVSDLMTPLQWRSSRAYSLLARPLGVEHLLTIPIVFGATGGVAYTISRSGPDFSDRDRDVVGLLQPALAVLHRPRPGALVAPATPSSTSPGVLTAREHEVLASLAGGHSAQRIAGELHLSPRTVRKHLQNVYAKLGVGDRLSAVNVGRARGWLP